jgi:hypothetical protein
MVKKAFVLILSAFSHASWNVLTLVLQPNSEVSVSVELENENNLLSAHSGGRLFFCESYVDAQATENEQSR